MALVDIKLKSNKELMLDRKPQLFNVIVLLLKRHLVDNWDLLAGWLLLELFFPLSNS